MKIGIDIRETLGNKTGKGFYAYHIMNEILEKNENDKVFNFILYSDKKTDIFKKFKYASLKIIKSKSLFWHFNVYRSLKKDKIDLFWSPTSYIIPFLIGKNLPYIITVHDIVAFLFPSFHNRKAVLIEKFALKKALKYAKKIFVVSENTGKDLIKHFRTEKEKLIVTYNGIKKALSYGLSAMSNKNNSKYQIANSKYILTIGTLEPRKNQIRLIQSFSQIAKKFPEINLLIGGGKGWAYENIFEEVKKLKLQERVKFLGYINNEDLPNLYKNAILFAFPSLYEGFGIPVIEAMSYGCPVLTSNNSSLSEISENAAFLINPLEVKSIANGLEKILSDNNLRKNLIKEGFNQCKKFSWSKSAENIIETFKDILITNKSCKK